MRLEEPHLLRNSSLSYPPRRPWGWPVRKVRLCQHPQTPRLEQLFPGFLSSNLIAGLSLCLSKEKSSFRRSNSLPTTRPPLPLQDRQLLCQLQKHLKERKSPRLPVRRRHPRPQDKKRSQLRLPKRQYVRKLRTKSLSFRRCQAGHRSYSPAAKPMITQTTSSKRI